MPKAGGEQTSDQRADFDVARALPDGAARIIAQPAAMGLPKYQPGVVAILTNWRSEYPHSAEFHFTPRQPTITPPHITPEYALAAVRVQMQVWVRERVRVRVQERVQVQVRVQMRVCENNTLMRRPAPFRKHVFNPMLVGELILPYQPTSQSAACPRQLPANALAADRTEQIIHGK